MSDNDQEIEHDDNIEGEGEQLELRDVIGAEFDKAEAAQTQDVATDKVQEREQKQDAHAPTGRERDEQGRFAARQEQQNAEGQKQEQEQEQEQEQDIGQAPTSWKPAAQQAWAQVPAPIREEVMRREHEMQSYARATKEMRTMGETFQRIVQPHMRSIQEEGSTPERAVENMLNTAHTLKNGDPYSKAHMMASIIQQYQVPVDLLDQMLSSNAQYGQRPPMAANMPQQPPQPQIDPQQLTMQAAQMAMQAMRQQQVNGEATAEVAQFLEEHPEAQVLRNDMADLIERYPGMSLQEAFDNAIIKYPFLQRQQTPEPAPQPDRVARSRRAASSVKPTSTPAPSKGAKDLRSQISEAWNEVAG